MGSRHLTIGVDFGTTFSGVAYSNPKDEHKEPFIISDWGAGLEAEKVPTIIRYNVSDHFAGLAGYKWGYQVKHHERRQEWFKLALDPMHYKAEDCVDLSQTYQSELAEPPDYSRDVTTLITDYLTALRKQVMKELERKFTAAALKSYRIDWVITTPAVWSMKAKDDTLRCAEKAGMGSGRSISLVSEPEAAAAYAFSVIEPMTLKAGNNIVVCDAGGGTVDLITYRIVDLAPLEVEESAVSCGGKCGGVFVNRIFEKMIDNRIGKNSGLTDIGRHQVLNHFETYVKRDWADEDESEEYFIPAPGAKNNPAARIAGGSIVITAQDLKTVFDPVVNEVLTLVKRQIDNIKGEKKDVSAVLLVGGFGQSRYLRKRLEEEIKPISLLCPPNGWSAIARGAVVKGVSSRSTAPEWRVVTRKAKQHYGIDVHRNFEPGVHDPAKKFFSQLEGVYKCNDLMTWFVNRGEDLGDEIPRTFCFYRNVTVRHSKFKWEEKLLSSFHESEEGPMYYSSDLCKDHVTLKVDFTSVPKEKFEKRRGHNGQDYYRVDYEILATFHSAHVEYAAQFQGQTYGRVKAHYCQ